MYQNGKNIKIKVLFSQPLKAITTGEIYLSSICSKKPLE